MHQYLVRIWKAVGFMRTELDVKCAVVLTLCLAVILSTRWLMAGI